MYRRIILAIVLCLLGAINLPSSSASPAPREGFIDVPGGRVWYRIVGSGPGTPLLVLHGGPGAPSYYLKPLAALGDERPVIFYDQLGCGHSDHPTDTALWRIERFVAELAQVRKALGLKKVHLYGHSWGAILATDYLLTKPKGVRSVILAGPCLSASRWMHDADSLRATLPDSVQAVLTRHEKDGTIDSPEYQAGTMVYYQKYLARRIPWSADVDSTFGQLGQAVYGYMNGPSEFSVTGTLKSYERADRLHEITAPALFVSGRYDEATPGTTQSYQRLVPGSKLVILENSGHLAMQDEPERYVQVLRDFLHQVEARK